VITGSNREKAKENADKPYKKPNATAAKIQFTDTRIAIDARCRSN